MPDRLNRSEDELRACILRGVAALVGFATLLVCASVYLPSLRDLTGSPAFRYGAFGATVLGVVFIIANGFFVHSHRFQRLTHILVAVSVTALLIVAAHAVRSKTTVPIALGLAALLVGIAAPLGFQQRDLRSWALPLLVGLIVLLVFGLFNSLVLRASWLETLLSIVGVVLFVALTVFDANVFSKHPEMCRHDCCEEGVFNVYLNFSNLAAELMGLRG